MKKMLKRIVFVCCLVLTQAVIQAQTVHVVIFCDTNDRSIGENKESERKITINEMQTICEILDGYGYDMELRDYHGDHCNKNNLMKVIRDLDVGPKDVVFFYYGGHGSRAVNNDADPFPQMCLGEDYQENWVPATLVKNMIMQKNPRLAIILTGCCNKEDAGVSIKSVVAESKYTSEASIDKEAYKKLFLDTTGCVMMTSSKAGQYSYSGKEGGVFCLYFWYIMELVGNRSGEVQADWNDICESVKKSVADVEINSKEGIVHQEPYYQCSIGSNANNNVNPTRQTTRKVTVNNQASSLSNDINSLLDQTLSVDQRLRMVDGIKNKHFTDGAKVIVKGRNMTTNVGVEDVDAFLRRIVLYPHIKHINIISEDGAAKKSGIIVHEVRTN